MNMPSYSLLPGETLALRFQIKDANGTAYLPSESSINITYLSDCGTGIFIEDEKEKYIYFYFQANTSKETGYIILQVNATIKVSDVEIAFCDKEKINLLFKDDS